MKYIIYKNDEEIKTVENKFELYEFWNAVNGSLKKLDNFLSSAGFWMMDKERNIYEAKTKDGKNVKYWIPEYEKLIKMSVFK